jgi:signal transduction histidine kinase
VSAAGDRNQTERLDRVLGVVRDVRHSINNPLTAIMAEAEFLLMDGDQLSEVQENGLKTIVVMARRIRDLSAQLKDLDATPGSGQT